MKRFVLFVTLSLVLVAGSALADNAPQRMHSVGPVPEVQAQAQGFAKALGDTIYLIGNPRNPDQYSDGGVGPQVNGTFQDQFGNPGWYGWTHEDETYSAESFWNVSTFQAISGTYSMWCGTTFDGDPGYGNAWSQNLVYTYQVANGGVANTVQLIVTVQNDSEPGYDYTYVEYNLGGVWNIWNVGGYDSNRTFNFNDTVTYQPGDYVGSGSNQIQLRIRCSSDGAWSDEDGLWDTNGFAQIDDIQVYVGGALVEDEGFEAGPSGTYNWVPVLDPGVGDYAALYLNLQDEDICVSNFTAQVAFVDDGVVVPGTGGSACTTWCYGPGGFIVNNTGGLQGPDYHISNILISPELTWPAGNDGAYITFSVFRHEELGAAGTWPGMFYQWEVRSVNTGNPADLDAAPWNNRNFVQFGGPDYLRQFENVTDLMENGRTHAQLGLRVIEYGYVWGWVGTDGTPAPYFDNVQFVCYPFQGPGINGRSIDWFNDNFPAIGDIDLDNLANNAVRLDCAQNVAQQDDLVNYPGDTIWFDITAVRGGSVLNDMPKMHVAMRANPLFDSVRVLPAGFTQTGDLVEGWVYGDSTYNANGGLINDRYNFDLPDDDFFFPGDVLHYYIEAQDNLSGDIGTTTFPGDLDNFGDFDNNLGYAQDFQVRALPTLFTATLGDQPKILFWQDAIDRGGQNEWFFAMSQLGYKMGVDYDMYATNGPSSGVGNGLGGRATSAQLAEYETMIYTSGTLSTNLLANGDFENDPSNDLAVVTAWFGRGDKNAFMTGDDLVTGLLDAGAQGAAFVNTYFNVNYVGKSVLGLIGSQTAPTVKIISGNGVIATATEWIAYGGCPVINTFDAITPNAGAVRLAEFTDPNGNIGVYPYAAASRNVYAPETANVIIMPVDFMHIYNTPGFTPPPEFAGIAARGIILSDVLTGFGNPGGSNPIGVTPDLVLAASNYPNPFNPNTTIKLTIPRTGKVSLKVFNVRGELVRTLVNGQLEAGTHDIVWDGKSDQGSQAASGVYFYETRHGGEVKVNKMALVK
jgi:hypothetical protein